MLMRRVLTALLLLAAAAPLAAQARCFKCKGEGFLPCTGRDHDAKKLCGISRPHLCDAMLSAKCCGGILREACPGCNQPLAVSEIESERARRAGWLGEQRKVEETTRIPFSIVQTDNFVLRSAIPSWKSGDRIFDRSRAAHLFADRLETMAARFQAITGVLPAQRQTVWLMPTPDATMTVTLNYMGGGHRTAFKLYSGAGQFATWPDPARGYNQDELFHQHVVHHSAHLLVQAGVLFQRDLQSWFDEGLAHWIEIEMFKEPRNFCFQEINVKGPWEGGDWAKRIFSEASSGKDLAFSSVLDRKLDQLRHREIAYCWSFVDGLARGPGQDRFPDFFAAMKRSNDGKRCVDEVLGLSTAGYQEAWRPWFLRRYGGR
jgi:hypothetical protein